MHDDIKDSLTHISFELTKWLNYQALPLWLKEGFQEDSGGFSEAIDWSGQATTSNRRARIHPRQIYCFAEAGARGWDGQWYSAITKGLVYFDEVYGLPSGFYGSVATSEGLLVDNSFDLYNQAFAILAFAHAAKALPDMTNEMSSRASSLLSRLKLHYGHPYAGFEESIPPQVPLRSNPHMHLFEAALACEEQKGFDEHLWMDLADELANLCMRKFIDAKSGGVREFFNSDWGPLDGLEGRIMEPGHQFEWAWLLARWSKKRERADAMEKARHLFDIGEAHGVCPNRDVAIMALLDDFSVHDPLARLWPQAEWLKAAILLGVYSSDQDRTRYLSSALRAAKALNFFLDTPLEGTWRDKLKLDRSFIDEASPASSLYHIVCAIYALQDCLISIKSIKCGS